MLVQIPSSILGVQALILKLPVGTKFLDERPDTSLFTVEFLSLVFILLTCYFIWTILIFSLSYLLFLSCSRLFSLCDILDILFSSSDELELLSLPFLFSDS